MCGEHSPSLLNAAWELPQLPSNAEECSSFRCESKFVSQTQRLHFQTSLTSSLPEAVRTSPCQLQTLHLIAVFSTSGYHITELFTPCLHIIFKLTHALSRFSAGMKSQTKKSKTKISWKIQSTAEGWVIWATLPDRGALAQMTLTSRPTSATPWIYESDLQPVCHRIMLLLPEPKC